MNDAPSLLTALVLLAIVFFVFLLLREVFCWYWKINRSVALLNELIEFQNNLVGLQAKSNEKLEVICDELTMLRQQQLEISIKQLNTQRNGEDT